MELLIRCGRELFESLASGILFGRFLRGTGGEYLTAGAMNRSLLVFRMDLCFHEFNLNTVDA